MVGKFRILDDRFAEIDSEKEAVPVGRFRSRIIRSHVETVGPPVDRRKFQVRNPYFLAWTKDRVGPPERILVCLLYTSPSPRDGLLSRMPSSA